LANTQVIFPDTKKADVRFLWYQLNDEARWPRRGVAQPFIRPSDVKAHKVFLPPLDEQRRIAAILDKADVVRGKRKYAVQLLDRLTHSIFLEMFGEPTQATADKINPLGDLVTEIGSGWSPTCLDRPAASDEPGVLKLSAITGVEFAARENKALPSDLRPKPGTEVAGGDILFCRKNTKELVGSSVYVWETRPQLYMSDLIFRLIPDRRKINPLFLQTQISLPSQRRRISEMSGGAAGSMPNVSKSRLRDLEIFLPQMEAQIEFDRVIRSARTVRLASLSIINKADSLFYSLQRRAFSGELA
jgi:type I restriction enzyme S subunit